MREKLYRSRRQRVLAGVAGGLAQYFNIDPIIVRVLMVVATLLHGIGILLYIILWIVVPEEPFELAYGIKDETAAPEGSDAQQPQPTSTSFDMPAPGVPKKYSGRIIAGAILIGIGVIFLFDRFIPSFDLGDVIPFMFVLIGAILVINSVKK
jgi:phage shock protein C